MASTAPELVSEYIAAGIAVFPVHGVRNGRCTCNRACPSPAKHPLLGLAHRPDDPRRDTCRGECGQHGHGLHDATTDPGQVAEWLARYPHCNWAIRPPTGVIVLDVDPRHGGDTALADLERRHGPLPATLTARTGGGGLHHWLTYHGPTRGKLCAGVDVKTNTGYLVAPPSTHICGGTYTWTDQSPAAPAPAWVRAVMNPPRRQHPPPQHPPPRNGQGRGDPLVEFVRTRTPGLINDGLYWAACRAAEQGLLDDAMADRLTAAAGDAAGPTATRAGELQSRRTIDSARRRPRHGTGS